MKVKRFCVGECVIKLLHVKLDNLINDICYACQFRVEMLLHQFSSTQRKDSCTIVEL